MNLVTKRKTFEELFKRKTTRYPTRKSIYRRMLITTTYTYKTFGDYT